MPVTASSSTDSRGPPPRPGALDAALAEHGARVDQALEIEVPTDELVRRMSGRWICEANGHVYNEQTHPPQVAGQLRPRRFAARSSAPTTGPRRSAPGWSSSSGRCAR